MRRGLDGRCLAAAMIICAALTVACGGGETTQAPAATAPAAQATPIDPATTGTVTGRITFAGTAPAPQPIRMTSDPSCPQGTQSMTETVVVGSDGGLRNVFVYVKDGLGDHRFAAPATPVTLEQRGCYYVPHVLGIQVGQPLEVVNNDPTLHNVHAVPKVNGEFNVGQPLKGMKSVRTFTTKEVMVPFKCDVHGWMNAYVGVLDHPFYAVTAADGSFSLKGLPAGTYVIEAWHEKLGTQTQTVTVAATETEDLAMTFKL